MQASKSSMDLSVQDFLAGYSPEVQALAKGLRSLIYSVMPNAVERVYPGWKAIWYGPSDGMRAVICVISPLKTSVNLGISRGIELPDPHKLLSGTGKRIRHVKVQKAEDIANPALRALLEAAVALGGV